MNLGTVNQSCDLQLRTFVLRTLGSMVTNVRAGRDHDLSEVGGISKFLGSPSCRIETNLHP